MRTFLGLLALLLGLASALSAGAATDITGQWSASFDTQIGRQDYVYQFRVKGSALTGKASSGNGESEIQKGRVAGQQVTFIENFIHQGTTIAITYAGTIASADEIRFTRQVGEFASEELVARRVKP